jgi:hypothetical protein
MTIGFGAATQTALAEYFIERYNLVGRDAEYTKNRPTLAMVPRDTEKLKMGNFFDETLRIANGFSGSPDWLEGNKNYNVSTKVKWRIGDPYAQYARLSFDTLALARNNLGTLIDIKGSEADGVRDEMLNTLEFELWNDGKASRGQVISHTGTSSSTSSTVVATLATASDVYNFPFGAMLVGNTVNDGSGTSTNNHTSKYKVTDLDPVGGTVSFILTVDNGANTYILDNDYLFVAGSANAYMPGIPQFIPASAPSDTLLGVARTGNPALSGWRFSFKSSISETIQRSFATMGRWVNRAADRFVVVLSTTDWLLLSMEREGRVFENPGSMQKWGLEGLTVRTPFGPITCVAIPQMSDGRGYILDFTSWKLYTLNNLPHVIDEDGLTFIRGGIDTADGYKNGDLLALQFRIWKVLLCLQPMSNATFPTK